MAKPCTAPSCKNRPCVFFDEFRTKYEGPLTVVERKLRATGGQGYSWSTYVRAGAFETVFSVTSALMPHLPSIPFHGEEQLKSRFSLLLVYTVQRILVVLGAVIREFCEDPPPRLEARRIADIIAPKISSIVSWKWLCTISDTTIPRDAPLVDAVELLSILLPLFVLACDSELEAKMLCSPDIMDALLVIYASEHDTTGELITKGHSANLLHVFSLQINHVTYYGNFAGNLGIMLEFTAQLAARTNPRDPKAMWELTGAFDDLCFIFNHLVGDWRVNRVLLDRGLVRDFMPLAIKMRSIHYRDPDRQRREEKVVSSTQFLTTLCRWADHYRGLGWKVVRDFILPSSHSPSSALTDTESLLPIFVRHYKDHPGIPHYALMFLFLTRYMGYRRVLDAVGEALRELDESWDMSDPVWDMKDSLWVFLNYVHQLRVESVDKMYEEGGVACANLRHWSTCENLISSTSVIQSCAGCLSVVYCSEECQKEDWESVHKHECIMMAREYQDRVDAKLGFPQRARIQTIVLISLWINLSGSTFFEEIEALIAHRHPSVGSSSRTEGSSKAASVRSDFVFVSRTFIGKGDKNQMVESEDKLLSIKEFKEKAKSGRASAFLEERFERLVEEVKRVNAAGKGPEIQLLCFVMPYGAQKWHILCAATVPKSKQEKSQVTFGMMQLESLKSDLSLPPTTTTPCSRACCT
ncbi:hypothetical protein BKA70DRAFT_1564418 [Coprinopsis sp. MPI-PUGE-AT-0042]|nr:hypothetical protein BKA70DRAFT_1564418 [Coprinopsis sp. MPI-PUGE-AT-0042]